MGAGLVSAAFVLADRLELEHAPTRVLLFMANTAVDGDPQPAFWKGRDELALALGKRPGAAGYKAVVRAISALTSTGVLVVAKRPSPGGNNTRYHLLNGEGGPLQAGQNGGRSPSPVTATEDAHRPANGGRSAANGGRSPSATEDAHRPPEEKEENKEEGAPPEFCSQHPTGTSAPCRACGDARRAAKAWRPPKRAPRAHSHSFDPTSGYCNGCGTREDQA